MPRAHHPRTPSPTALPRTDAVVRRVVSEWRRLTSPAEARRRGPGAATLLAVSGGADSSALALALAAGAVRARLVIGHVVHDLRPPAAALADRDAARDLADRLGLEFAERAVAVRALAGNGEAVARRLRYAALAEMARERGLAFVATAHHARDQLETVLMALVRGAGPRGLSGVAERRSLPGTPPVALIRPMLTIDRAAAERVCAVSGWAWRTDETNADTMRLRSALRATVVPALLALRPAAAARAADTARLMRQVAQHLDQSASELAQGRPTGPWPRSRLRGENHAVLAQMLRAAVASLGVHGPTQVGLDRVPSRNLRAAVAAIASASTDPRRLALGSAEVLVTAHEVTVRPAASRRA